MVQRKPCITPGCKNVAKVHRKECSTCKTKRYKAGKLAPVSTPLGSLETKTQPTLVDSVVEKGNEQTITKAVHERVKTLEDLIRVCEIDTTTWEVVEWHANKWEMGYKDKDNEGQVVPLFQVKARLRKRVAFVAAKNEIESLKEEAKETLFRIREGSSTNPHRALRPFSSSGYMLELNIPDLHLGKLAWKKETGYQNYDLKIARQVFEEAVEVLIDRTTGYDFERIVFPVGNDFFHTDNLIGETTHGTRQDMDGRFHKTAHIGREMMVWAIERLREIAPVEVPVVPGNHDQLTAWHLGDSLECWFHDDPQSAIIKNEPILRKYTEFGKVMIMFTHGNRGKQLDYPNIMATEQPEMWGRTRYRECHIGHWHKTQVMEKPSVNENHGVRIRTISSLCAADAWHSEHQLVGNLRSAEAFVWNKHEGLVGTATFTVPE